MTSCFFAPSEEVTPEPTVIVDTLYVTDTVYADCQDTLILQPGSELMDTYVQNNPSLIDTPLPNQHWGLVAAWTASSSFYQIWALFQFDLSGLPSDAIIDSAALTLQATDASHSPFHLVTSSISPGHYNGGNNSFAVRRITSAWSESTVTWNSKPSYDLINQVLAPKTTSNTQTLKVDVTDLISDQFSNPSTNYGFQIMLQSPSLYNNLSFYSSDHDVPSQRPRLEIYYHVSHND